MGGALVLYSGGLDSLTLLHFVKKKLNYNSILALGFDYGQPHIKELQYAERNCKKLGVPFIVRKITGLQVGDMVTSPEVVGRNSLFLTYGAIVAKENGLDDVFIGVCGEDSTRFPDCRSEFIFSMSVALQLGVGIRRVSAPFIYLTKEAIVAIGKGLGVDYSQSWSCYMGGEKPCGKCEACRKRVLVEKILDRKEN